QDLYFIDARGEPANFLHVEHLAPVPVVGGEHLFVAVAIDGHPIEDVVIELGAKSRFAQDGARIIARMFEDAAGVNAALSAAQRVADFNVGDDGPAGPAAHAPSAGDPFDRHLRNFAAVGFGIDGDAADHAIAAGVMR